MNTVLNEGRTETVSSKEKAPKRKYVNKAKKERENTNLSLIILQTNSQLNSLKKDLKKQDKLPKNSERIKNIHGEILSIERHFKNSNNLLLALTL